MWEVHSLGFVLDVKTTWTYVNSKYHLDIFLSYILFVLYQRILIWEENMLLPNFLMSFLKDVYPTIKVNKHYKYNSRTFLFHKH